MPQVENIELSHRKAAIQIVAQLPETQAADSDEVARV